MSLTAKQKKVIGSCFLFEGLEPQLLETFFSGLAPVSFPAGEPIYTTSNFKKSIGIITLGTVTVQKSKGVVLNTLGVGDCFGVAGLFHPVEEYVTTVRAKSFAELVFITDRQLTQLFGQYPETAINYITFLSKRIHFLNRKIDSFTAPTTAEGLKLYLLENQLGGEVTVSAGYSQLARQLNMGRASLYRSLEQLEKQNIIRREDRKITVLDLASLSTE
ncbi:Crp/Fnr family transcriptional regulator [Hydrogenoanaerobacterium sp.]|uniref:Crp/Fnr family transcriptional regulator n=1 Tax=Hydrogenoanaerobacterium sp. TaxID=2953763 RepID=UPI00289A6BC2|nr:Crp/Fnr family transcriptional regulator [Hydrogenoanaerobacterium sp.]